MMDFNMYSNYLTANIKVDTTELTERQSIVHMPYGTEYYIELFNHNTVPVNITLTRYTPISTFTEQLWLAPTTNSSIGPHKFENPYLQSSLLSLNVGTITIDYEFNNSPKDAISHTQSTEVCTFPIGRIIDFPHALGKPSGTLQFRLVGLDPDGILITEI